MNTCEEAVHQQVSINKSWLFSDLSLVPRLSARTQTNFALSEYERKAWGRGYSDLALDPMIPDYKS